MTQEKTYLWRKVSSWAGVACSCFFFLYAFGLFVLNAVYGRSFPPQWLTVECAASFFSTIIAGGLCILAAVLGFKKSN